MYKITICYIPSWNPSNTHTIEIGRSALEAHLAHGDYERECNERGVGDKVRGKKK